MPKMKTHRGAAKRFKKTASGYKRSHSHARHILTKKSTKRNAGCVALSWCTKATLKPSSR